MMTCTDEPLYVHEPAEAGECSQEAQIAHSAHLKKEKFLQVFAETGNIRNAARVVGIGRRTHYHWLKADEWYRRAFRDARRDALDALESEARRRAVQGVEEPHYDKDGNLTRIVRKYSDTLLIFLLKGANPRKYNPQVVRVKNDNRDQRTITVDSGNSVMVLDPKRVEEIAERRAEIRRAFIEALGGEPSKRLESGSIG